MTEGDMPDRAQVDADGHLVYADDPPAPATVGAPTDARNRALRTLLWGLLTDVGLAVLLFLLPIFGSASTDWSTLDFRVIGLSLAKTVVMAALSYLARRFKVSPRTTTA